MFLPALPSTVSPVAFWNAMTASNVDCPNTPSTLEMVKPKSFSACCNTRTREPLEVYCNLL